MGTMARTAVVAGTATAASGAVVGRQQRKAEASAQEQAAFESQQKVDEIQQQMEAMQAQEAQQAAGSAMPPPAPAASDMMSQLTQLAQLKTQGLLTDEEFDAAKARLFTG